MGPDAQSWTTCFLQKYLENHDNCTSTLNVSFACLQNMCQWRKCLKGVAKGPPLSGLPHIPLWLDTHVRYMGVFPVPTPDAVSAEMWLQVLSSLYLEMTSDMQTNPTASGVTSQVPTSTCCYEEGMETHLPGSAWGFITLAALSFFVLLYQTSELSARPTPYCRT